jgi:hypothetical protein
MQLSDALHIVCYSHANIIFAMCTLSKNDDPATSHKGKTTVAYKQWKIRNYTFNVCQSNGGICGTALDKLQLASLKMITRPHNCLSDFFLFCATALVWAFAYLLETLRFTSVFYILRHSVGLLGRVISSSQGLYLYTNTEKRTHIHKH